MALTEITYCDALRKALQDAMREDETVVVIGEEAGATHEILCRSCMEFVGYPSRSWSM